ncbi:GntR family transcriptional regulator [Shimia sp. SK013]|uniref:GntR family transcriptional regulator n=1 Tax=Shimia sp. SK013 TaxID=1389006 RepID=UPI00187C94FF|nr:GntR family transcriptional regulator [Shimia sp. SK013]
MAVLDTAQIDLAAPAGDQVYQLLRTPILEMQMPPGCPVSEAELGNRLGVSRTPVREALLRLREEGLINTYPSRGSFVATLSRERILGAQFLREAIELAVVRRVMGEGLKPFDLDALEGNLKAQSRAAKAEDFPRYHALDDQFHSLLASATGLPRTAVVLEREKIQLDRLRCLSLKVDGQLQSLLAEHQAILDAITSGDEAAAVTKMQAHCRTVLNVLETLSLQHQDYFE